MAVAAVPRAVVRLSVTEALYFHLFGPEQAFGGVGFASGSPWRAHARIPRRPSRLVSKFHPKFCKQPGAGQTATATSQGMINFREYEPCVLSTYVAGTDNSHDRLSKPSMKP
jgi:hypothetical protein